MLRGAIRVVTRIPGQLAARAGGPLRSQCRKFQVQNRANRGISGSGGGPSEGARAGLQWTQGPTGMGYRLVKVPPGSPRRGAIRVTGTVTVPGPGTG